MAKITLEENGRKDVWETQEPAAIDFVIHCLDESCRYIGKEITQEKFIETFMRWLSEISPQIDKHTIIKTTIENNPTGQYDLKISCIFYTFNYKYHISASFYQNRTYLGCTFLNRRMRPGEGQFRGGDFPDGEFSRESWFKIKNAIIKNELENLCELTKPVEGKCTCDENSGCYKCTK